MSVTNLVFYHAGCSDGMGAAWAARKKLQNNSYYIPLQHNRTVESALLHAKRLKGRVVKVGDIRNVYFVDICPPELELWTMLQDRHFKRRTVTVIDHHEDRMEKVSTMQHEKLNVVYDRTRSGAALAYRFFNPESEIPKVIQLIEDRDLYKFSFKESQFFTDWLYNGNLSFRSLDIVSRDEFQFAKAVEEGRIITGFKRTLVEKSAYTRRPITLAGVQGLVCNAPVAIASELGHHLVTSYGAAFGAVWHIGGGDKVVVSLRSEHGGTDVGKIASSFGGGGSKSAAGFVLPLEEGKVLLFGSPAQTD